ncbi:MAG: ankyrin repeat domain-containing protein [Armatimonadaceae bacterium]
MKTLITRRQLAGTAAGFLTAGAADAQDAAAPPSGGPVEAPLNRDYPPPGFKPSWRKPQVNRQMAQDFVIYAHSDIEMVKTLLDKEPGLINAFVDWGGGDWESALNGASHMGKRDIVMLLLERGARPDLFCAAMLGQLDTVKAMLTLQPKLIDAKGPHGFTLHFHAQVGGETSRAVLDYLQSIRPLELKPIPFLKKP